MDYSQSYSGRSIPKVPIIVIGALLVLALIIIFFPRDTSSFSLLCSDSSSETVNQLVEEYQGTDSSVSIQVVTIPDEEYSAETIASHLKDGSANLALLGPGMRPADLGDVPLHDMREAFNAASPDLAVTSAAKGQLGALPLCGQVSVIAYHPSQFAESQGKGPGTWMSFLSDLLFLNSKGVVGLSLEPLASGSYTDIAVLDSCMTYGGRSIGTGIGSNQEGLAGSRAVNEGFDTYCKFRDFVRDNPACVAIFDSHDQSLSAFKSGSCAMVIATAGEYLDMLDQGIECAMVPIPGAYNETHYSFIPTYSLVAADSAKGGKLSQMLSWLLQTAQPEISTASGDLAVAGSQADAEGQSAFAPFCWGGGDTAAVLSVLWQASQEDFEECLAAARE